MYRLVFLLLLSVWTGRLAGQNYKPVLSLKGQTLHVPFMVEYLKDPGVYKINSKSKFKKHNIKLKRSEKRILRNKKFLREYFSLLAESCYYHYRNRKSYVPSRREKACHKELLKNGNRLLKTVKVQRGRILYNVALSLFALQRYREAHKQFSQLKDTSPLALKARLANYLIDLEIKKSVPMVSYNKLSAKFDVRGKIIINLATARHLVGLDLNGQRERKVDANYRHYLNRVSPYVSDIATEAQEQVLAFTLGVVSKAESSVNWQQFPIRVEAFAYTSMFPALLERQALYALNRGRFKDTIVLYKRLLPMVKGKKNMLVVKRLLIFARKSYQQTRNAKEYQKIIHLCANYLKSVSEKELLDKNIQHLVTTETKKLPTAPDKLRHLLLIIKDLTRLQSKRKYVVQNKEIMATIYLKMGNPSGAVEIYYSLFQTQKKQALHYINLAIKYQHLVANWPEKIDWQRKSSLLRAERLRLQKMYEHKAELMEKEDWYVTAQRGLLALNLNMKDQAYGLWINNMDNRDAKITNVAIGIILDDYLRSKNWLKTEMLIKRCLRFKIVPLIGGKKVDVNKTHADALNNITNYYIKIKDLSNAFLKGTEFFKTFPKDKRQPENLLRMSEVLMNMKNYPQAMSYLIKLVSNYPGNIYYQRGLLRAANLARMQGDEQKATVFYRLFFHHYPRHRAIKDITFRLIDLYRSLRLYGDLQGMYDFIFSSSLFTLPEKQKTEIAAMELEEKYGSRKKAREMASKIIAQPRRHPRYKALAVSLLARYYYAGKNIQALMELEVKLDPNTYEYRDPRNELSFYIAKSHSFVNDKIIKKYEKTPMEFLKYISNSYNLTRKNYLEVCKLNTSRFCLPAYLSLIDSCMTFIDAINTIELSAASTRESYELFTQTKKKLISFLEEQKKLLGKVSVNELQSGNAPFDWMAKSLLVFSELNLSYINAYLSEPDFIQFNLKGSL